MLHGQTGVRPEENVSPDGIDVNDVFEVCVAVSDSLCSSLFENLVYVLQRGWLREDLGPAWGRQPRAGPLVCPRCGGRVFVRRGWRSRKVRTSRGSFEVLLAQVSCRRCHRVFRPYALRLGLPTSLRFLPEVEEKMIDLATQLSYDRSRQVLMNLLGVRVSGEAVRQRIFKRAAEEKSRVLPRAVAHCLVDNTKVKAGEKPRGEETHMAISVERGPMLYGRSTLKKRLLSLSVGDLWTLKWLLRSLNPQRLVHDGFLRLSDCARNIQRCRWHLPYVLRTVLSVDGLRWRNTIFLAAKLRDILWHEGPEAYDKFMLELRRDGLQTSARYLENARAEVFTYRGDSGFEFTTTSPIEREMRELNRRMDVGARWSVRGAENMLWVLFTRRFRHRNQLLQKQELLESG